MIARFMHWIAIMLYRCCHKVKNGHINTKQVLYLTRTKVACVCESVEDITRVSTLVIQIDSPNWKAKYKIIT